MTVALATRGYICAAGGLAELIAVVPDPVQIQLGSTENAYAVFNRAVDGDQIVSLSLDNPALANVPAAVTVLDGEVLGAFTVESLVIGTTTLRASHASIEKTASLEVQATGAIPAYRPRVYGEAGSLKADGVAGSLKPQPYSAEEQ